MLEEAVVFIAVAEQGSISLAAKQLGVTPSSISKRLSKLEGKLNTTLLYRTTRGMNLTEAGKIYLKEIKEALEQVNRAERAVTEFANTPEGRITVSAGPSFARYVLVPAIAKFTKEHPNFSVKVIIDEQPITQASKGADICFQWGKLKDTHLIAKQIMNDPIYIVCNKDFAEAHDVLNTPVSELLPYFIAQAHNYAMDLNKVMKSSWPQSQSPHIIINSVDHSLELALLGAGLVATPRFSVIKYLNSGALVDITSRFPQNHLAGYAVFHTPPSKSTRISLFVEYVQQTIKELD